MKQIYLCLSVLIIGFSSCSEDREERYLGNWDAAYLEINEVEPVFCGNSWAEVFKLDDGRMRVELQICEEEFFATTSKYNYDFVEFEFADQLASDVEIVVEGTIEYIGGGEIRLEMFRDVYVDGFFVSGSDYYGIFD